MKKTIALLLVLGGSLGLAVTPANALPAANTPVFGLVLDDSSGSSTALNSNQDPSQQAQDPNSQTVNGDDQADNSDYDTNSDDDTMDNTDADSDGSSDSSDDSDSN